MKVLSKQPCVFTARTEVWTVRPEKIAQDFRVTVTMPQNVPVNPLVSGTNVAGVIGLDGDLIAGGLVSAVSNMALAGEIPQTVSVAIGYPLDTPVPWISLRNRDFTPTPSPGFDAWQPTMFGESPASGGGGPFLNFISDELMPEIEASCGVSPDEWTLVGGSLGGLFTAYALLARPARFKRYCAISPAFFIERPDIHERARAFAADPSPLDAAIFFCCGEFEGAHVAYMMERLPEAARTKFLEAFGAYPNMIEDAREFANILEAKPGLKVTMKVFENEGHNTVLGVSLSHGLRWLHKNT